LKIYRLATLEEQQKWNRYNVSSEDWHSFRIKKVQKLKGVGCTFDWRSQLFFEKRFSAAKRIWLAILHKWLLYTYVSRVYLLNWSSNRYNPKILYYFQLCCIIYTHVGIVFILYFLNFLGANIIFSYGLLQFYAQSRRFVEVI
jgi:hypothetical protein